MPSSPSPACLRGSRAVAPAGLLLLDDLDLLRLQPVDPDDVALARLLAHVERARDAQDVVLAVLELDLAVVGHHHPAVHRRRLDPAARERRGEEDELLHY